MHDIGVGEHGVNLKIVQAAIDQDSFLLRNPERLEICSLDRFPDTRWLFEEKLCADLDATDRFTDDSVLACEVVLRIELLKFEHRIEIKRWFGIS